MRQYMLRMFRDWMNGKKCGSSGCGSSDCGTPSASFKGDIWYSYDTEIAYRKDGKLYLSEYKYSATTSRQQSALAYLASQNGLQVELVADDYELRKIINL